MRASKLLLTLTALSLSAPAIAAEKARDQNKDPNKRICKSEKAPGSRVVTERTCMPRAEWDLIAEESKRTMEGMGPKPRVYSDMAGSDPR